MVYGRVGMNTDFFHVSVFVSSICLLHGLLFTPSNSDYSTQLTHAPQDMFFVIEGTMPTKDVDLHLNGSVTMYS